MSASILYVITTITAGAAYLIREEKISHGDF